MGTDDDTAGLVNGGQGREPEEIEGAAIIIEVCLVGGALVLAMLYAAVRLGVLA